jgi:hypothetical protein
LHGDLEKKPDQSLPKLAMFLGSPTLIKHSRTSSNHSFIYTLMGSVARTFSRGWLAVMMKLEAVPANETREQRWLSIIDEWGSVLLSKHIETNANAWKKD